MKVKLPLMIQDPVVPLGAALEELWERYELENESYYLDGPVTERVAVLDFDEDSTRLEEGATFIPPRGRQLGTYDVPLPEPGGQIARQFNQVSVLATILETMSLVEDERVLGRPLRWAFDAPQLLVVPRAGNWANAFYERETHSLQFFFFETGDGQDLVYTSLSRDIVAHETAHAILDGISPHLYNALAPQSLALHEAFADLTAVIMAMRSRTLAKALLEESRGKLQYQSAFSRIAEQFGIERHGGHSLRDLSQMVRMDQVTSVEPHELSTVLSSALYEVLLNIYGEQLKRLVKQEGAGFSDPSYSLSGKALAVSVGQLARMIFRGLDYLPPGEISFADYGRAILAADKAAFPHAGHYRQMLRRAFVDRKIVPNMAALNIETNFEVQLDRPVDLEALVESDWVAYQFANEPKNRALLQIPSDVESFVVHRRLETEKKINRRGDTVKDIIFRVSWDHLEDNRVGSGLPAQRRVTAGTTLVINADRSRDAEAVSGGGVVELVEPPFSQLKATKTFDLGAMPRRLRAVRAGKETLLVRARLTSDLGRSQQEARDDMLEHLMREGLVELDERAMGPDGNPRAAVVHAETRYNAIKLRGTARLLHIA